MLFDPFIYEYKYRQTAKAISFPGSLFFSTPWSARERGILVRSGHVYPSGMRRREALGTRLPPEILFKSLATNIKCTFGNFFFQHGPFNSIELIMKYSNLPYTQDLFLYCAQCSLCLLSVEAFGIFLEDFIKVGFQSCENSFEYW